MLLFIVAAATLALVVATQLASATHPRPKGATPVKVPLVVAYEACTSPNRTHGPPLAFPSCSPPTQASDFLTVGTPDANGAPANSAGFIRVDAIAGVPGPPDDSDIVVKATLTDVRCKAGTSACGNANAAGGPDYTGELGIDATVRITDHYNATSAGGGTDPATASDVPFGGQMLCTSTADTSIGGLCDTDFVPQCVGCLPGWPKDGKRMVAEITQFRFFDGGPDGRTGTAGNTLFAVQGLFVP